MIEFVEMPEIKTSVEWPTTRAQRSRLTFHHLSEIHTVTIIIIPLALNAMWQKLNI